MPEFTDTVLGKRLNFANRTRRPSIGLLGESFGTTWGAGAVASALYEHSNANVTFDYRTYANGGQMFAVGGSTTISTSPRGLFLQSTVDFPTRPTDIAIIAAGYNDQPATSAAAITVADNIIAAGEACLAAGASAIILYGVSPRGLNTAGPTWMTMNNRMRNYCRTNPNFYFVDVTSIVSNRTAASTAMAYRGTNGTDTAWTDDGTHWSAKSVRAIGAELAKILAFLCPVRTPRVSHNTGTYDPVNLPYCNMLGDAGNMMGTSGLLNGSANTGVAGPSTANRVSISTSGGVTVTPSIVTGADGENKQRLTLGGTISGTGLIQVSILTPSNLDNSDANRVMEGEVVVDMTAADGLTDIYLRPGSSTHDTPAFGSKNGSVQNYWGGPITQRMFMYNTYPIDVPNSAQTFNLLITFRNDSGFTPTGTIDISRFGAFLTNN